MREFNLPTIYVRAFAIISERTRTRIARLESNVSMTDDYVSAVPRNHPGSREISVKSHISWIALLHLGIPTRVSSVIINCEVMIRRYTEAANGTGIAFEDGSRHTFCSRQRPQLAFSQLPGADGVQRGRPLALFTGAPWQYNRP